MGVDAYYRGWLRNYDRGGRAYFRAEGLVFFVLIPRSYSGGLNNFNDTWRMLFKIYLYCSKYILNILSAGIKISNSDMRRSSKSWSGSTTATSHNKSLQNSLS